ncbi:MAG: hypothetical protein WBQ14_04505 [Gaiellaceae bacterium]
MKLGIAVVYLVRDENFELLDLHLRKIRTMTGVPYTIYAGVTRPAPRLAARLEAEPRLEIVPLPATELSGSGEHAFYLERLIAHAARDGATHLVTMHVDSFPVRPDWAETIGARLSGDVVLATLSSGGVLTGYSACLFFGRDFWVDCRPKLLLSAADRKTAEYGRFAREHPHHDEDTGAGYVFRAYASGRRFAPLERLGSGAGSEQFGGIHGDLVFHLAGAFRYEALGVEERTAVSRSRSRTLIAVKNRVRRWVPRALRRRARKLSLPLINSWERPLYDQARSELLDDPERYFERLRQDRG